MAIRYVIDRPAPLAAVQWDGTNEAEMNSFAATYLHGSATANADGSLRVVTSSYTYNIPVNWWLIQNGFYNGMSDEEYRVVKQEVSGTSPYSFDITGS